MLIPILRTNNHYDYVKGFVLDTLIEAKEIIKFKRGNDWVVIGIDRIRPFKRKIVPARVITDDGCGNISVMEYC